MSPEGAVPCVGRIGSGLEQGGWGSASGTGLGVIRDHVGFLPSLAHRQGVPLVLPTVAHLGCHRPHLESLGLSPKGDSASTTS